jgi:hypothetical protein
MQQLYSQSKYQLSISYIIDHLARSFSVCAISFCSIHPGVQGIVWYLCWLYFAYEEPSDHPNISKAELNLIGKHWNTKVGTFV